MNFYFARNGFEIVIDDNSHEYGDQRRVFIQLFPKLARGGVYIVAVCRETEKKNQI